MLGCRGCEGHDVPKHLAAILARGGASILVWRLFRSNAGVASCPEDSVVCNGNVPPKLNLRVRPETLNGITKFSEHEAD